MQRRKAAMVAAAVAAAAVVAVLFVPMYPVQEYSSCVCPPSETCLCPDILVGATTELVLWSPSWLFAHYGGYLSTQPLGYFIVLP
ncbi:MAG: hypothetical protein JRN71_04885 [Nitrososphaerota archaeon]|jgi:hypothetical protein|nr:hypothetical protein [Nitrososphaerota archaeon]MDG6959818.1 hypothetical protein [Nitrososphaerota archaeon]MDG6961905.1 hypothetical protein [Nitrososphaerota archaeon]MDG6987083.1 hypothetical protein [Nitrososphaerota archaeon]MDG7015046.1 hypothetical protein [Nitrososphaerota archaeon]